MPASYGVTGALLGTALLLSLLPVTGSGLTGDRDQPVNIEADKATVNEKTGNSIYEGMCRCNRVLSCCKAAK